MNKASAYPVGTPGQPWADEERRQWRARLIRHRSYAADVVPRIEALADRFDVIRYGSINYGPESFPLLALRSRSIDPALPAALVTGGVHGYETSGVMGALEFLEAHTDAYAGRVNLLVVPCVSPWAYERINRWDHDAIDPNRNFRRGGPAREATALIGLVDATDMPFLLHIDLHETTDSDEDEFSPALAARYGKTFEPHPIPDGFYLCADSANPQSDFQQAIISAVERVTHIAAPDEENEIIGSPVVARGVIEYPLAELGLCAAITGARFTTTTEVYPDSPRATPEQCNLAQATAVRAGLDFALEQA